MAPANDTFDASNRLTLPELYEQLRATGFVARLIQLAFDEDLGVRTEGAASFGRPSPMGGDITTTLCIPPYRHAIAQVVARQPGVVAGLACLPDLASVFLANTVIAARAEDGDEVVKGQSVAVLEGPLDEILGLERTLLNLVGRLSGVATKTRTYVEGMGIGHRARLYDTRKTTPGMRVLEKYAVRCGGGYSHRMGLHDAVLIKDNHLAGVESGAALCDFVAAASRRARTTVPAPSFVEVEVDTLAQFESLLSLPKGTVDIVLLDNMGPEQLRRAAAMRDERSPSLQIEASGGITLESLATIAATGVDRISSGALTHSAVQLDFGLDIEEKPVDRRP